MLVLGSVYNKAPKHPCNFNLLTLLAFQAEPSSAPYLSKLRGEAGKTKLMNRQNIGEFYTFWKPESYLRNPLKQKQRVFRYERNNWKGHEFDDTIND